MTAKQFTQDMLDEFRRALRLSQYSMPKSRFVTYEESDIEWLEFFGVIQKRQPLPSVIEMNPDDLEELQATACRYSMDVFVNRIDIQASVSVPKGTAYLYRPVDLFDRAIACIRRAVHASN